MRGTIDRNNSQESGRVLHSIEMVEKRIFHYYRSLRAFPNYNLLHTNVINLS